jgi:hypothetical protein
MSGPIGFHGDGSSVNTSEEGMVPLRDDDHFTSGGHTATVKQGPGIWQITCDCGGSWTMQTRATWGDLVDRVRAHAKGADKIIARAD